MNSEELVLYGHTKNIVKFIIRNRNDGVLIRNCRNEVLILDLAAILIYSIISGFESEFK